MTNRIEKSIVLNARIEKVWRALTNHEEFGAWFRVKLDGPFVPGEISRGHITHPGYEHLKWEAKVQRMDAPRHFSFTWHPYAVDPKVDYSTEAPTLVDFALEPIAEGTRLVVVETGFEALPAHRQPDALRMNDGGWAQQMTNIKTHVEE